MDIGRRILQRMAELGIKTNVELAKRMGGKIHPYTIGKWISGKSTPRGTSLIALTKALKISADLILFDEGDNIEQTKELTKMVSSIVQAETKKILTEAKTDLENELVLFLKSKKIPPEIKAALVDQARNLLKLYEKVE